MTNEQQEEQAKQGRPEQPEQPKKTAAAKKRPRRRAKKGEDKEKSAANAAAAKEAAAVTAGPEDTPAVTPPVAGETSPPPNAGNDDTGGQTQPEAAAEATKSGTGRKRRRPRRRKKKTAEGAANGGVTETGTAATGAGDDAGGGTAEPAGETPDTAPATENAAKPKSRSRRRKKKTAPAANGDDSARQAKETATTEGKKDAATATKTDKATTTKKGPSRKLLINAEEPEECRIVLLEDGKVEAFHIAGVGREKLTGNIYKGRIVAVEPSLQAAFVDIGTGKNGFLSFNDIHPEYYNREVDESSHWSDFHIQDVIDRGTEVIVEVLKEPVGNKGAALTTYISLPGRYLVLMPGSDSHGISRKLSDNERDALRKMISDLKLPEGVGYIVRTASKGVTKTALQRDLRYLLKLWNTMKERAQKEPPPVLLHQEQDIIARYLRDHFTTDIDEIVVDTEEAKQKVEDFLALLPPSQRTARVRLHLGSKPIFDHYKVESQIETIYQPVVKLPSGGSIVISPTEALVAIDVNSGSTSKDKDFEESIFLANLEAADELARQLRLRDLGGLIVVDFIDMRGSKHPREVEKRVREAMKRDKAKVDISRISKFGLMQISRQRLGPPVHTESYITCPHCQGRGVIQTVETQVLVFLRKIQGAAIRRNVQKIVCDLPLDIATYMQNRKRADLAELEAKHRVQIQINAHPTMHPSEARISWSNGS